MLHLDKVAEVRLKSDSDIYQFLGMQSNKSEAIRMGLKLLMDQYGMADITNPYGEENNSKAVNIPASQDNNSIKRKKRKAKADNTLRQTSDKKQENPKPKLKRPPKEADESENLDGSKGPSSLNGLDFFNENWH